MEASIKDSIYPQVWLIGDTNRGYSDGTLLESLINQPCDVLVDMDGNIWFSDNWNHRIRKAIVEENKIITICGTGVASFRDGTGVDAELYYPLHFAEDEDYIYFTEWGNSTIRKIFKETNEVKCITGQANVKAFKDGHVSEAQFNTPKGIVVDSNRDLIVCDSFNNVIRKIWMKENRVELIAGIVGARGYEDGIALNAKFAEPAGIALNKEGDVIIADAGNNVIRKYCVKEQTVITIAGLCVVGFKDGVNSEARFSSPWDVDVDLNTNDIYVADSLNNRVRKITPDGTVTTIKIQDERNTPGMAAFVSIDYKRGNLIVSDNNSNTIRAIVNLIPIPQQPIDPLKMSMGNLITTEAQSHVIIQLYSRRLIVSEHICSVRCPRLLNLSENFM